MDTPVAPAPCASSIERLPREVLLEIFKQLAPLDAVRAGQACRRFHGIAHDQELWRHYIEHGPSAFTTPDLGPYIAPGEERKLYWELQTFYQRPVCAFDIVKEGVESSPSLDEHTIGATLQHGSDFWCSAPPASPRPPDDTGCTEDEGDVYLVYRLKQPISIVTSVEVTTYPGYAPSGLVVSVGFAGRGGWVWTCTSPAFPVLSVADEQEFELGPRLCVGGYVRLSFSGAARRTQRIAIRHVRAFGTVYGAIRPGVLADALFSFATAAGGGNGGNGGGGGGEPIDAVAREAKRARLGTDGPGELCGLGELGGHRGSDKLPSGGCDRAALNDAWRREAQELLAGLKYLRENRVVVEDLFCSGQVAEAIEYLLTLPSFHKLRGRRTLHLLEARPERSLPRARDTLLATRPGCPVPPVWEFLTRAAAAGRLNTYESIALARHAPEYGTRGLAAALEAAEKLTPSEDLGALFLRQGHLDLALSAFLRAGAFERAVHALMLQGAYGRLVALAVQSRTALAWSEVMAFAVQNSPRSAVVDLATALLFPPAPDAAAAAVVGLPLPREEVLSRLGLGQLSQTRGEEDLRSALKELYSNEKEKEKEKEE